MSPLGQIGEEAYGLIFATETGQETLERVLTVPWKGLFIDLGPQYLHNRFVYKINDALVIGNEKEALNNPCDVIKRGKNGAKWDEVTVQGNGLDLPYPTGAGDLFDVVLIFLTIMDVSPEKALKEAVRLAQKACMIPGSSTKMELLRDFHHSV